MSQFQQPYYGQSTTLVQPHRGTIILVLGILSLVVCGIMGPIAWVMGNTDLREMAAGRMDRSGEGATQAGRICGMIATILMIVGLVFSIVIFCLYFAVFAALIGGAAAGAGGP